MVRRVAVVTATVGALVAGLLGVASRRPLPRPAVADAVEWAVDDTARTITATVHLDVFVLDRGEDPTVRAQAAQRAAEGIKAQSEALWSRRPFACYTFMLVVDIAVVAKRLDVRAGRVGIRLDAGIVPALSGSRADSGDTVGTSNGNDYLSQSPSVRIDPATGPNYQSTWPLVDVRGVWSHEMGHVLGLNDNYVLEDNAKVQPGAAKDIMYSQGYGPDATTIARMIRRSGKVDESKLNCGVRLTYAGSLDELTLRLTKALGALAVGFTVAVDAKACGVFAPSNDPTQPDEPYEFKGTVTIDGEVSIGILGFDQSGGGELPFVAPMQPGVSFFQVVATGGGGVLELGQQVDRTQGLPVALSATAAISKALGTTDALHFEWLPPGQCP